MIDVYHGVRRPWSVLHFVRQAMAVYEKASISCFHQIPPVIAGE
jgi:hypothetical protein